MTFRYRRQVICNITEASKCTPKHCAGLERVGGFEAFRCGFQVRKADRGEVQRDLPELRV